MDLSLAFIYKKLKGFSKPSFGSARLMFNIFFYKKFYCVGGTWSKAKRAFCSHVDNKDSQLGSELIEDGSTTIKRHSDSEVASLFFWSSSAMFVYFNVTFCLRRF